MVCPAGGRRQHGVPAVVLGGEPVGGGWAGGVAADLACQCLARPDWKISWQDACCIVYQGDWEGALRALSGPPAAPQGIHRRGTLLVICMRGASGHTSVPNCLRSNPPSPHGKHDISVQIYRAQKDTDGHSVDSMPRHTKYVHGLVELDQNNGYETCWPGARPIVLPSIITTWQLKAHMYSALLQHTIQFAQAEVPQPSWLCATLSLEKLQCCHQRRKTDGLYNKCMMSTSEPMRALGWPHANEARPLLVSPRLYIVQQVTKRIS